MISPSYSLTATERVLPRLALDFTTAALDPRVTFTRSGNTATVIDSAGVIVAVNADIPRFDYDPVTLACKGLLIEESRTNVLLNSLLDGTSLATQSVTVTAAARTLSFYGTGAVVLSGAHSATVTGTGAYPTRTTLTFTPSAGTLTLTVTGTVQFAQLELGAFPTSFIPTSASQVTRTADIATMTGSNFSDWYNSSEGTFVATYETPSSVAVNSNRILSINNGVGNRILALFASSSSLRQLVSSSGTTQASSTLNVTSVTGFVNTIALTYKLNEFFSSANGGAVSIDTLGNLPIGISNIVFGSFEDGTGSFALNGYIKKVNYYKQSVTTSETQAFSKG